ncbi:E3 ubiquitin/ISG15 ligase TRIM25-like [Engystomops pustulosus]|uniref:E3 ubiquitin/ISG15 ligase TRIM25-like n=1 Tax=Engystomops pustulosus TaxID=76066 RepID=UPI003AFACF19
MLSAMASAGLGKELECSICLSLYTDPVTLRCGHNFCRVCIEQVLNTQDGSGVYSCPECRTEFQERPGLQRNITLRNVVENFLSTQPLQQEEVTGIFCTYCIHSPVPAVKSCLMCEASLCDDHLRVHSKEPEHILIDPSTSLENRKCPVHKKILEYYCTEDAACICVSCCLIGEHQGHKLESLEKASEIKKKKLSAILQNLFINRQTAVESVESLEEWWRKAQEKASGEAERVTALFIDIRRRLDDLEKRILREISRQEMEVSLPLSALIHKLEMKKIDLSRKMKDIEELCNMTDPLTVLQEPDTGEHDGGYKTTGEKDGSDREVGMKLISDISHTLSDLIKAVYTNYVQDSPAISLDINTAANNLLISDDLKTATWTSTNQKRPESAERFQDCQVMSSRGFTSGRHYWDVEISGSVEWRVGMCYPSIERTGRSYIGNNNKSWCLYRDRLYNNQYSVRHNSQKTRLPHQISSHRVRIYVDYEAGQLFFYELCDPIRPLVTIMTTFTEPLHAVIFVWGGSIKILEGAGNWNK